MKADMPMKKVIDEYLEAIWVLGEKDLYSLEQLKNYFGSQYDPEIIEHMKNQNLISMDNSAQEAVDFTEDGYERGRRLIRAHRLAERLLYDVFGRQDYEVAACEFEHIVDTDLVDGICTLLGHPRRCPDGLSIPEGDCCKADNRTVSPAVLPAAELQPGQQGRVVSVNAPSDQHLHILETLQIRPGMVVKLHQSKPSIVIECEGSSIALDDEMAREIYVWPLKEPAPRNSYYSFGRRSGHSGHTGQSGEGAGRNHHPGAAGKGRAKRGFWKGRRRHQHENTYDCGPQKGEFRKKEN